METFRVLIGMSKKTLRDLAGKCFWRGSGVQPCSRRNFERSFVFIISLRISLMDSGMRE